MRNISQRQVAGVALALFVLALVIYGVRTRLRPSEVDVVVTVPQPSFPEDTELTPEMVENALRSIHIFPRGAKLPKKELLLLNTFFLQMDAHATAYESTSYIPDACDVFRSLDATFDNQPGWRSIQWRASRFGKVETFSVAAFISARCER